MHDACLLMEQISRIHSQAVSKVLRSPFVYFTLGLEVGLAL